MLILFTLICYYYFYKFFVYRCLCLHFPKVLEKNVALPKIAKINYFPKIVKLANSSPLNFLRVGLINCCIYPYVGSLIWTEKKSINEWRHPWSDWRDEASVMRIKVSFGKLFDQKKLFWKIWHSFWYLVYKSDQIRSAYSFSIPNEYFC